MQTSLAGNRVYMYVNVYTFMHIDILHHHLQDYKYENTHKKWKEEVTTVIGGQSIQFYKYTTFCMYSMV